MGTMAEARINTSQRMVLYRDFIIQEGYDAKTRSNVWGWTHEDYSRGTPVTGDCQTMFEAIDAVEAWYSEQELAA